LRERRRDQKKYRCSTSKSLHVSSCLETSLVTG
jgi:hypothetical protein